MARLKVVSLAHWFTALSFFILFATLVNAFFQLIWADFRLPLIGHFPPFEWLIEIFAWTGLVGIVLLMLVRQINHPRFARGRLGRRSRFFGSNWWMAYYVEFTIFFVTICILSLRTLEARLIEMTEPGTNMVLHFPLTYWMSGMWGTHSEAWIREAIYVVAAIKILVSFAWMITISVTPTMGVAWHRFLAFFNIWTKRHADGRTSLGELQPMTVNGKRLELEDLEDLDEDTPLGVGKIQDFSWKNLLDFTTCTECGRCQSQCPAWNTDKPLSPKLLVMTLRDHTFAKAPWLTATEDGRHALPEHTKKLDSIPLVGQTGYEVDYPIGAYDGLGPDAVVDQDVLWSCTTCGACVEQCPVDIEHVDAIVNLRRHQVLLESAFPAEFGGLFRNMESKQNPWGMNPKTRMDWTKGLEFDVPVVGQDVESLSGIDYLFWVGCAGAFEDRAKKTTRAVAELLHTAGVSFAVLGEGEACTGDSARRAGNEILFQALAQQNVEALKDARVKKIVVTCAHCFNTLRNEYPQFGGHYEVLHHTQLLNRLVRDKRLVPVTRPEQRPGKSTAREAASSAATVTYHDPCYLGRHNHVYSPPRDLIGTLPGVQLTEMPRHGLRSFCCGAGGARMWAEEKLGTRINVNRTDEAIATGAERIAIGCPFCRVMLSDGLTAAQADGKARDEVEVVDIAQMLLAAIRPPIEVVAAAPVAEPVVAEAVLTEPAHDEAVVVEAPVQAPAEATASVDAPVGTVVEVESVPAPEPTPAAEAPAASAPAPTASAAPAAPVAPAVTGKMSASDALALLAAGGAAGGAAVAAARTEETPAAPAPTEAAPAPVPVDSAATDEPAAAAPAAPAPEQSAPASVAPAEAASTATSSGKASWAAVQQLGKERGILPASEVLAMLGGAGAAPSASAPAAAATPAVAAPAPAPASPPVEKSEPAPAVAAPAPVSSAPAPVVADEAPAAPTAPVPAEKPPAAPAVAQSAPAAAAPAVAQSAPVAAAPAVAQSAPAAAAPAVAQSAPAAAAPAVAQSAPAAAAPAVAQSAPAAAAPAVAQSAPAAAAPAAAAPASGAWADVTKLAATRGIMPASEVLAMLGSVVASMAAAPAASAPAAPVAAPTAAPAAVPAPVAPPVAAAPAPVAEPAPAPAPPAAKEVPPPAPAPKAAEAPVTVAAEPAPAPKPEPVAAPAPQAAAPAAPPAPVSSPAVAPAAPPVAAAPEPVAPSAGSEALARLREHAGSRIIPASEALAILRGEKP